MQAKIQTVAGMAAILATFTAWTMFVRSVGPSYSTPGWLNPPAEPAR